MRFRQKPVHEQIIVITGASSGIGRVTARAAARQGAGVVAAARDEAALQDLVESIRLDGGRAAHVVADVRHLDEVQAIAEAAVRTFGGFDTWVNNAGVTIYGRMADIPIEEERQLFETNYWGVVYGSRVAAEHFRSRGGTIVTVGSVTSDQALPLQGAYSASKHAVKGFTDALRMELEAEGAPVRVTLIKPAAIDTPLELHARNHLQRAPRNPPPVYAPELVAEAVLAAASHPVRDLHVGGGGRLLSALGMLAPRLTDYIMERLAIPLQQRSRAAVAGPDHHHLERTGRYRHVRHGSLSLQAGLHPWARVLVAAGLGAAAMLAVTGAGWRRRRG